MSELGLDLSRLRLHPKQARGVFFRAPRHPTSGATQIDHVGFFGDYGGGKSWAMMLRFLLCALFNSFDPEKHSGDSPPMSGLVAPTFSDLKRGPLVELSKIMGRQAEQLIAHECYYGQDQHIELINGHKILLYSAGGAKNGPTLCQLAADEFQETCYAGQLDNLKGRVRDLRSEWLNFTASGIAERGHVQDAFQLPERDVESGLPFCTRDDETRNRLTVLLYPEDNKDNLAAGYVEGMQGTGGERRGRDADGWLLPPDAMFPSFSRRRHLRLPPGLERMTRSDFLRLPVNVSVDPGRRAAVIWWVKVSLPHPGGRKRAGILIVDQWMARERDAEEIAVQLARCPWRLEPGKSKICLDPTMEVDQVRHFQDRFRGCEIVQHRRGPYHKEDNGVRAIKRALLDHEGFQRLYIAPWVHAVDDEAAGYEPNKGRRGVVEALGSYLATKPKDKWLEHAADVVRYATQDACPLPKIVQGLDAEAVEAAGRSRTALGGLKIEELS